MKVESIDSRLSGECVEFPVAFRADVFGELAGSGAGDEVSVGYSGTHDQHADAALVVVVRKLQQK